MKDNALYEQNGAFFTIDPSIDPDTKKVQGVKGLEAYITDNYDRIVKYLQDNGIMKLE